MKGAGLHKLYLGTHTIPAGANFNLTSLFLQSVTLSIGTGTAPLLSTVDISGATLAVADSHTMSNVTIRGDGRLTMQNNSALTVTGVLDFQQGTITAGGRVILAPGGTGTLSRGGSKLVDGVVKQRGRLTYNGDRVFFGRDTSNLPARIENAAGGTFIADGEGDFFQN